MFDLYRIIDHIVQLSLLFFSDNYHILLPSKNK